MVKDLLYIETRVSPCIPRNSEGKVRDAHKFIRNKPRAELSLFLEELQFNEISKPFSSSSGIFPMVRISLRSSSSKSARLLWLWLFWTQPSTTCIKENGMQMTVTQKINTGFLLPTTLIFVDILMQPFLPAGCH